MHEQEVVEDEKNRENIERIFKEEEEKMKVQEQKDELDRCIAEAQLAYINQWDSQCAIWKTHVGREWNNCRDNQYSWETDAENRQRCIPSTPDYDEDDYGSCILPGTKVKVVEDDFTERKDECYRRNS